MRCRVSNLSVQKHRKRRRVACLFLLVVGALFLGYGIYDYGRNAGAMAPAIHTQGTVVAIEDGAYEGSDIITVEFKSLGDKTIHVKESVEIGSYKEGKRVPVIYQPGYPQFGGIYHFSSIWGTAIITGAIGLLFTTAGISLAIYVREERAEKGPGVIGQ